MVGTYTGSSSKGIYSVVFDASIGQFKSDPQLAVETTNPSFLALSPTDGPLFAVNEVRDLPTRPGTGGVSAFGFARHDSSLALIDQQPSEGTDPCFLVIDRTGRYALVANYTSGTVAVLPIAGFRLQPAVSVRQGSGSGPVKDRQAGPHAHHIVFDPSQQFAIWTDLGADRVVVDRFDAGTGRLESTAGGVTLPPGSGPRHLAWHPSGRVLYVLNELSSTVTTMRFDQSTGTLEIVGTTFARHDGAAGVNTAAEIVVSKDGRFLYTSNRGDDEIMAFAIDPATFVPALIAHVPSGGRTPRFFTVDPSGRWMLVANQNSDSIVVLRVDSGSGVPAATSTRLNVPSPVHLLFR